MVFNTYCYGACNLDEGQGSRQGHTSVLLKQTLVQVRKVAVAPYDVQVMIAVLRQRGLGAHPVLLEGLLNGGPRRAW